MDTGSAYLALARSSLDECVSPEKRAHYYQHRVEWFPGVCCDAHAPDNCHDKRTPGLLKSNGSMKVLSGCARRHIIVSGTTINPALRG